jgi:hypothetical protein
LIWFRLALALGKSVAECQACVDSAEFGEWQALLMFDPWGTYRDDSHNAWAAFTTARYSFSGTKQRPGDFLLKFDHDDEPPEQDWKLMKARAIAWAKQKNAAMKGS